MFGSILFIFVLVALNGFFVSVEFAAVASRRARIQVLADAGNRSAQLVQAWLENPATRDRLIAGSQLGITIVSLALGAIGENTVEQILAPYFEHLVLPASFQLLVPIVAALPLVISLIIITSLHVVLGEQVPKVAALHAPERFALLAAWPMRVFTTIFKWFVDILDWATRQILRLFGLQMVGEHLTVYTIEELKQILTDSEEGGVLQTPERQMLDAIFDLGELVVRQVMIPRTEMIAVEADTPLDDIVGLAHNLPTPNFQFTKIDRTRSSVLSMSKTCCAPCSRVMPALPQRAAWRASRSTSRRPLRSARCSSNSAITASTLPSSWMNMGAPPGW